MLSHPNQHKCRKRFTLMELLIVIAIMTILASLLCPAINHIYELAISSHCKSNLRQLNMAFQSYASDYNGFLMPYITGGTKYQHPGTNWARFTYPYYGSLSLLSCPGSEIDAPTNDSDDDFLYYDGNYGWNYDGTQGNRGPLVGHLKAPSATYLVFDSGDPCIIYGANNWENLIEELDLDWDSRSEGCNRHLNRVNVSFADGHLESRQLHDFLAAPCQNWEPPWCMKWENKDKLLSGLQSGSVPFPNRK